MTALAATSLAIIDLVLLITIIAMGCKISALKAELTAVRVLKAGAIRGHEQAKDRIVVLEDEIGALKSLMRTQAEEINQALENMETD